MSPKHLSWSIVALISLALAGCGGGGNSASPAPAPAPAPTPATYTIGGAVSGLAAGQTVVLQNNAGNNASVSANGSFTFTTAINSGAPYAVTVLTPPTGQTCTVATGSGTATANVTNVAVTCVTNVIPTYTVGGAVSGLAAGQTVVLQNNAGNNASVSANGSFTFTTAINSGAPYAVTVLTPPTGQTCTVATGSGTATANVTNVAVTCVTNVIPTYTVGGTLSGLATGGNVIVQLNSGSNLTVSANGPFTFGGTGLTGGTAYRVAVANDPTVPGPGQTCAVTAGTGTVAAANVTTVRINCTNIDGTAPALASRFPLPLQLGSRVSGSVVTIGFSEALNPATVTTSSVTVATSGGTPVPGSVALAVGNQSVTFTPTSRLSFDTEYVVTVTTAVRDPSGNALAANATWRFNSGKRIAIGFKHTCARTNTDTVKCWGRNNEGQLGYDDTVDRGSSGAQPASALAAVNLGAGRTAVALTAGDYHTCALLDNGDTKCWGSNWYGELGQGSQGNGTNSANIGDSSGEMGSLVAVNLGTGRRAVEVVGGQYMTCARLDDNGVKCWGLNSSGQLGQGNTTRLGIATNDIATASPISFGTGLSAVQITVGHFHGCAVLVDGSSSRSLKCWGANQWGQLGIGNNTVNVGDAPGEMGDALAPLSLGATVQSVLANGGHSCALLTGGSLKCWGLNTWGQAGLDVLSSLTRPVPASCSNGVNDCIGDAPGEVGSGLAAALTAARYSIGFRHNCAITTSGQFKCWGTNEEGQMGLGTITGADDVIGDQPGEMSGLPAKGLLQATANVEDFTAGGFHTCVSFIDGAISCWGLNDKGQLGQDGTNNWGDSAGELASNTPVTGVGL